MRLLSLPNLRRLNLRFGTRHPLSRVLLVMFLLVLSGIGLLQARGASSLSAPQVIESVPQPGEELNRTQPITINFDQDMNRGSVEQSLTISEGVQPDVRWQDDRTLIINPPAEGWQRAKRYTIRINATAQSKAGVPIRDTVRLELSTIGALEVTALLPTNNAADVDDLAKITVTFNRPVVPLTTTAEQDKLPSPIRVTPAIEGKGEWISTSIYVFTPSKGLTGGTEYTVTVPEGLTDVTGAVLEKGAITTFRTRFPYVLEIFPYTQYEPRIVLDQPITITFSQAMDRASIESAFALIPEKSNDKVSGVFVWKEGDKVVTFTPSELLDYNTNYDLTFSSEAKSATGAVMVQPAPTRFVTVLLPAITYVSPIDGATDVRDTGFRVEFTTPMNLAGFEDRITVEPKPGLRYDNYSPEDGRSYFYGFSHEPSTSYRVTVNIEGLTDKYGTPLVVSNSEGRYRVIDGGKTILVEWTTPDYAPEVSLRTGNAAGVYNAYSPSIRVYSLHRNISQVELSLYRIAPSAVPAVATSGLYDRRSLGIGDTANGQFEFLRRWSVNVENPRNILRYDLLNITDEGPSADEAPAPLVCDGAPESRMSVGDKIVVSSADPRPVRIRSAAGLQATQVGQSNPGTQFDVIGGPVCLDGYVWWQISNAQITGWAAEGSTENYFFDVETSAAAAPGTTAINASEQGVGKLAPGAYYLQYRSPQLEYSARDPLRHVMLVSTANITLKVGARTMTAWVTDIQSGQPMPNMPVTFSVFRRDNVTTRGTATTDDRGIATFVLETPLDRLYTTTAAMLDSNGQFGFAGSGFSDGLEAYDFDQPADYFPQFETVYLYSDRSLYRPGQPIYFRGVIRQRDDMQYTLPTRRTIPIEIRNDNDEVLYETEADVNEFGTFTGEFTSPENAGLGTYRIIARPNKPANTDANEIRYDEDTFTRYISVAQYRVPEFQVSVTSAVSDVLQGEKFDVTVDSSYFFGGAVSNANVSYTVYSLPYSFNPSGEAARYNFTDYNEDSGYGYYGDFGYYGSSDYSGEQIATGEGVTDAQGRLTISITADKGKAKGSQRYTIEASVTDESDQVISGRAQVVGHQGEFYIGATPREYIGIQDEEQTIDLITIGWEGEAKPATDLSIRVVERQWSSVQSVDPETGRTVWTYDVKETPVTEGTIRTGENGKGEYRFTPASGGIFKIYATSRDSKGNQITTSTFLWVAGKGYVPWRQQNSNRMDLRIDQDNYQVGDTASILIPSPFQGAAKALVTVERGRILKTEVIDLPTNSTIYELPITADMAPNAFVSVTVIKGTDENNPIASFRLGLVGFSVNPERYGLNITATADTPDLGPGDEATFTVKVTDHAGRPVRAAVGAGLTDLAVLSLLPDTSTPIFEHFYSEIGLGIFTSVSLNNNVDQQTQEILNTVKGGGGGGPESGIFKVRTKFVDTPLWTDQITDANGELKLKVTLPENLTTFRLDLRAVTNADTEVGTTLVGQEYIDILSTKRLLVRPITPRFFTLGDTTTLVAIVNNNTDTAQEVTARIDLKGAKLDSEPIQTATIDSKGRSRFEWKVTIDSMGPVDATFFAANADNSFTDAAKSAVGQGDARLLPVVRYESPETVGTSGLIREEGAISEGITIPSRYAATQGELDIRIDKNLTSASDLAIRALENRWYQSVIETSSRLFINAAGRRAYDTFKTDDPRKKQYLDGQINYGINLLYAAQRTDGGWGWVRRDRSDPLITSWALNALVEAKSIGVSVDQNVIEDAIRYLNKEQDKLIRETSIRAYNRATAMLFVLSRAGAGTFGEALRLFNVRESLSTYAKAYLALSFNLIDKENTRYTDALLSELVSTAITSGTGVHWEESYDDYYNWNTDTRTTSIALYTLLTLSPESQLAPNVVRWLLSNRANDAWRTPQETAWALIALDKWLVQSGDMNSSYTFNAQLNDKEILANSTATPGNSQDSIELKLQVKDLLQGDLNLLTFNRSDGTGGLYYTAHLNVYLPVDQIKAVSRGVTVSRQYTLVGDTEGKPITEARVGEVIQVTLTIVVPNDMQYVTITDPVPAGAEAVDPQLATSAVGLAPSDLKNTDVGRRGYGWWFFSETEFRDTDTLLVASYLPKGTYRYVYSLRPGLAGVYNVPPTTVQQQYFPEVYGRGDGTILTLLPSQGNDPTNE